MKNLFQVYSELEAIVDKLAKETENMVKQFKLITSH